MRSPDRALRQAVRTWISALVVSGCAAAVVIANGHVRDSALEMFRAATGQAVESDKIAVYERGSWRLARWDDLDRTVLWVSHIVVAHRDSKPSYVPEFRPPGFLPDPPNPERSSAEALAKAHALAREAAEHPERFAALARQASDDVITRAEGGSLGGIPASQLPHAYLDVLAVLRPGEVSAPIETSWGFHILMRRQPLADAQVAGKRIAIRYRGTYGGPGMPAGERSREEALQLARAVAARARSEGVSFDELVAQHSGTADRVQAGDMGVWSVSEPSPFPRELERLAQLKMNQVAEPIESTAGFEILKRTSAGARPSFAMAAIRVRYDATISDPSNQHSRAAALALARQLAARLAAQPDAFPALQAEHCCIAPERWTHGRGPVGLSEVVAKLEIGQIAADPVEYDSTFALPKRVDPETLATPPPTAYELPSPTSPDLVALVRSAPGQYIAEATRELSEQAIRELGFSGAPVASTRDHLGTLATFFEAHPSPQEGEARVARMNGTFNALRGALEPAKFSALQSFINSWTRDAIIKGRW